MYLIPGFIITLKKPIGTLIEFIGAIDHAKLYCLNRSVEPPQIVQKRLTELAKSDPPHDKERIGLDIDDRNVWIQKMVSKSEESLATVEAESGKDRAAKTRERQETLSRIAKKKAEMPSTPVNSPLNGGARAKPSSNKRKREISFSEDSDNEGEPLESPPKKHKPGTVLHRKRSHRTPSKKNKVSIAKNTVPSDQYLDFHGTKMSGVTFMLTPDLAKSGATVTFSLTKPSGPSQ